MIYRYLGENSSLVYIKIIAQITERSYLQFTIQMIRSRQISLSFVPIVAQIRPDQTPSLRSRQFGKDTSLVCVPIVAQIRQIISPVHEIPGKSFGQLFPGFHSNICTYHRQIISPVHDLGPLGKINPWFTFQSLHVYIRHQADTSDQIPFSRSKFFRAAISTIYTPIVAQITQIISPAHGLGFQPPDGCGVHDLDCNAYRVGCACTWCITTQQLFRAHFALGGIFYDTVVLSRYLITEKKGVQDLDDLLIVDRSMVYMIQQIAR